jgi:PAS domain S-box-containing protein
VIAETSATALTWNGEPAYQIVARDITEARVAEDALIRSEELLCVITDNSPYVIYLKDKNFRFLKFNKAFEKLYGVTEPEIIGRQGPHWLDQALIDELIRQDKIVLSSGKPYESEFEFIDPVGETHFIQSIKFPVFDSNGDVYGSGGITIDRTEFKLAEHALTRSEARLDAFFDHAPVGLALYDSDDRYVKVNQALAKINGISVEDHVGRHYSDVIDSSVLTGQEGRAGYEFDSSVPISRRAIL